jgi:hypothetical protein
MALQKTVSTKYSVDAGYWSLTKINKLDWGAQEAELYFSLYASKEAAKARAETLSLIKVRIKGLRFAELFGKDQPDVSKFVALAYNVFKGEMAAKADPQNKTSLFTEIIGDHAAEMADAQDV